MSLLGCFFWKKSPRWAASKKIHAQLIHWCTCTMVIFGAVSRFFLRGNMNKPSHILETFWFGKESDLIHLFLSKSWPNRTPQGASENLPEGLSKQGPQGGRFWGVVKFGTWRKLVLKVLEGCYRHIRDGHFFLDFNWTSPNKAPTGTPKVSGVPLFLMVGRICIISYSRVFLKSQVVWYHNLGIFCFFWSVWKEKSFVQFQNLALQIGSQDGASQPLKSFGMGSI